MANLFEFGPFVLNARERQLMRAGQAIHLQPKAFEVLLYLLEHAGNLAGKHEVLDAVWKDTFVTENSLTVCIRQIRVALGDDAESPVFIETIPTAGYRFIADVTRLEEAADTSGPPEIMGAKAGTSSVSRRTGLGILLAVIALAYLAVDKFFITQTGNEGAVDTSVFVAKSLDSDRWENSIAVLPFVNMSDDPDNEYFSDGLSEEITNLLARAPALKVIGRTSSFSFKHKSEGLREIGRKLNVKTILEGSVRKSGEQVRITAQLIDASDGSHIWSESYDRTLTDIFEIQDDVASSIIDALQLHVGTVPTRGRPTESPEAYALFLKARVAANVFDWRDAEALLLESVELDPNFAEAYEMLALVYWILPAGTTVIESQRLMSETAAKAIALDPDLVLAKAYYHAGLPGPKMRLRAIEAFERATRERPDNPSILEGFIFLLTEFGYLHEALTIAERYIELDPLSELANYQWPLTLYAVGRTEDAIAALEFANRSDWDPQLYRWAIAGVNLVENQGETAIAHVEAYLQQNGYPDPGWFRDLVTGGRDPETGQAYLDRRIPEIVAAMAEVDDVNWHRGLISLYLYFGYLDRYYELVLATDPVDTTWHPAGAHLWRGSIFRRLGSTAHPRYLEFAKVMGVMDIWEQRGPPDFCDKVDGQWVCE